MGVARKSKRIIALEEISGTVGVVMVMTVGVDWIVEDMAREYSLKQVERVCERKVSVRPLEERVVEERILERRIIERIVAPVPRTVAAVRPSGRFFVGVGRRPYTMHIIQSSILRII